MSAALMYCNNKYKKALNTINKNKSIYDAFEVLETEIKKLDYISQLNLYSAATQFLESIVQEPNDSINPLEVFILRCNSIVSDPNETIKKIGLALGVIAISISMVVAGIALGVGIGMLLGSWQTTSMFMASLLAAETAPLIVASSSVASGVAVGFVSQYLFFKEPKIRRALDTCVDEIKRSHLSKMSFVERRDEESNGLRTDLKEKGDSSPVLH